MMHLPEFYRLIIAAILGVLIFGFALQFLKRFAEPAASVASFSLEDTLSDIKTELQKLENAPGQSLGVELSEIAVTLLVQSIDTKSTSAALAVPVFSESALNASKERVATGASTITVVLVPPKGLQTLSAAARTTINFSDLLIATREALQRSLENEPKLDAKSVELKLHYSLVATKTDAASVKAQVLNIGSTSDFQATNSNTITLTYTNPAYAKKEDTAVPVPP